jgi:peroxiredoxin
MLDVNQIAPDFQLPQLNNGNIQFYEASYARNSVLIFYKYTCGTSRFTLPFLQQIYEAYGEHFFFTAIAQDPAESTINFREELKITIPTLLDVEPYTVSRTYGLHTVPSIFLIDESHKILFSTYGFVKQDLWNLADILAGKSNRPQLDLFASADVPELKPG